MAQQKTKVPEPAATYGAGYLYHYDPAYQEIAARLQAIGGKADIYEILGVQFNSEPDAIERFSKSLGAPVTLHSYEYCLGNVQRPSEKTLSRIQELARLSRAVYVGEHIAMMGGTDYYCGAFLQPPGTDEQTRVLIDNVKSARKALQIPVIIENASQFYNQIGPKTLGQQLREVSLGADAGILLSLSNVTISEKFYPQDREAFLAEIPLDRVRQIHALCNNAAEEKMPGREAALKEQEWVLSMLKQLAKRPELKPASVIFELEAWTDERAEPERLRDMLDMARSLFFTDDRAVAA